LPKSCSRRAGEGLLDHAALGYPSTSLSSQTLAGLPPSPLPLRQITMLRRTPPPLLAERRARHVVVLSYLISYLYLDLVPLA